MEVTELVDDLDGLTRKDVTTIPFALDGNTYEIDLKPKHRREFTTGLAPFIENARRVTLNGHRASRNGRPARSAHPRPGRGPSDERQWARENGWPDVRDRGRLPADARAAYQAATATA